MLRPPGVGALKCWGFDPRGDDRDRLRPYLVDLILKAEEPTTQEYKRADRIRTRVFDGLRRIKEKASRFSAGRRSKDVFLECDILATATVGVTVFEHGDEPESTDGTEIKPLCGWVLTQLCNFTGHPAASIPAGFVDGLPVGLQLAGQRHADDDVIAAFERQRP